MTDREISHRYVEMAGHRWLEVHERLEGLRRTIDLISDQHRRGFSTGYRLGYENDLRGSLPMHERRVAQLAAEYQAARAAASMASVA